MISSKVFRNTSWMLGGFGARALLQFLYFVIVARLLGSRDYGIFVAIASLVGIAAPFSTWGSGNILIKYVSRDKNLFGKYWGAALATTLTSSVFIILIVIGISRLVLPNNIPIIVIFLLAVSDLLFSRLSDLCGQAFQAFERLKETSTIQIISNMTRLIFACYFLFFTTISNITTWSFMYFFAAAISAAISVCWVVSELGSGKFSLLPMYSHFKEGGLFSIGLSSQTVYNDIDKTMLASTVSLDGAGLYAASYRIIDVAFTPIKSLLFATYAKFFQYGETGIESSAKLSQRILPYAVFYGILFVFASFLLSPMIHVIFGDKFIESEYYLKLLSPLVFLKSLHYLAADALTGAGKQGVRTLAQVCVAAINISLNLVLLPVFGVVGAIISSIACDFILAVFLWSFVINAMRMTEVE